MVEIKNDGLNAVADIAKKHKKKQKKQKKQQDQVKEAEEEKTPVEAEPISPSKKSKKKKKKKTKTESVEEVKPADPVEQTKKEDKPKKSKKKRKHAKTEEDSITMQKKAKKTSAGPYQQPPSKDGSFKKSFYVESESTSSISDQELSAFHTANEMTLSGNKCIYKPILSFQDIFFPAKVMTCCKGFEKPTPIQSQCWPILSSGRDIIGIAETGSGKTLAFSLPGIIHILDQKPVSKQSPGPVMLVVAPTRELAMQSDEVINKIGNSCGLQSLCIYGGVPKYEQKKKLRNGVHIVVATPGRLRDLVNENACNLSRVTYMVLDEADRMLDEGFEKDIRDIISNTHPERQIAMFSATWPESIQSLAHEFLEDPVKCTIGSDDLAASKNVTQIVDVVDEWSRDQLINTLLGKYHATGKNRVLLFVLYKKEAARVEFMLKKRGWNCSSIHGDKNQYERIDAVNKFKKGEVPLLIATDVAARGLDIPDVEYVLNYSFPLTIEDYVHRIGRTGRGGKKGISHTFFTSNDKPRAGELANLLRESDQKIPEALLKFGTHVKKKEHKLYGAFAKDVDMSKKSKKITFDSDDE